MVNRSTLVYWENGRSLTAAGEMLSDGFVLYPVSVIAWDDSLEKPVSDKERQRIVSSIRRCCELQGVRVVLE